MRPLWSNCCYLCFCRQRTQKLKEIRLLVMQHCRIGVHGRIPSVNWSHLTQACRTNPFHETMPMVYPKGFLFALKCRYRYIKRNCGLRKITISGWPIFIMPVTTHGFSFYFWYACDLQVPVIFWLASSVLWGLWEPAIRKIYRCCWGFVC